jgi:murein DD-endopeptidase MepM/ murein hydrolase activator NlpD
VSRVKKFEAAFVGLVLAFFASSAAQAADPSAVGLDLHVPAGPIPVTIAGTTQLVYELHLTNFAPQAITLKRVQVLNAQSAADILDLQGEGLEQRLGPVGPAVSGASRRVIEPGRRAVLYLEVAVAKEDPPAAVFHRVEYVPANPEAGAAAVVEAERVAVRPGPVPVLGPPLRGGPWTAIYGPSWERGHRRVLYAVQGRARIPGRFAIDWFRVDDRGRRSGGDEDVVADYHGYGEDVLAVADAVVAATRTDAVEAERLSAYTPPPPEDAAGNYVVLDLGDDRFAIYEHLKPGSIRVRPRERVRRGQVIAALGFSGQGTSPHLHFHVADADAPLAAEGTPYVFGQYELLGRYESVSEFGRQRWLPPDRTVVPHRREELPAPNSVVEFPSDTAAAFAIVLVVER